MVLAPMLGALLFGASVLTASAANAYGSAAVWQITISENCNNPTICVNQHGQPELGGFWGWAEFDNDNTGDAEFAFCGHGGPGVGGGGAGHESIDVTSWHIGKNGDFYVNSEIDTFTGHGTPVTQVIPKENSDTGIPASPGHYSTEEVMGFTAPGVAIEITVVKIPGR